MCVAPARLLTSPVKSNRTHTQVATGLVDEMAVLEVLTATELATLKQVKYAALMTRVRKHFHLKHTCNHAARCGARRFPGPGTGPGQAGQAGHDSGTAGHTTRLPWAITLAALRARST